MGIKTPPPNSPHTGFEPLTASAAPAAAQPSEPSPVVQPTLSRKPSKQTLIPTALRMTSIFTRENSDKNNKPLHIDTEISRVTDPVATALDTAASDTSPELVRHSSHSSLHKLLSNLSMTSIGSGDSERKHHPRSSKSSRGSSPVLLRKMSSNVLSSLGLSPSASTSGLAQSEAPAWKVPEPQSTAPETNEQIQAFIESVASDCRIRGLGGRFESWLELKRDEGKSEKETDRQIAHELWNAAYIIADIRHDSEKHGCLEQLDKWLAAEANTKLDVELAADLIHAKDRIGKALKLAQEHKQEHVFKAFLQKAREQGKPDVVLISELSPDGIPPWAPPVPKAGAPGSDKEKIHATLDEARNASRYRGQESEFDSWIALQNLKEKNDAQKAFALWNAPHIIRKIRLESEANGCLGQLDSWLVSEASTKLDVQLASMLTDAKKKLLDWRSNAKLNGQESAFLKFIREMRHEGKPDVVIVSELSQGGTPPWMPAWVPPPVPKDKAPENDAEAQALIKKTEDACKSRWLGTQFKNWIAFEKANAGKNDLQIAHTIWDAPSVIYRIRKESKESKVKKLKKCLPQLDKWLALQAKTKTDAQLAAELIMAETELRKAGETATGQKRDDFLAFVKEARHQNKPDIIIFNEWMSTQDPLVKNQVQAEEFKPAHEAAFQEMRRTARPIDPNEVPGWVPPKPPPESPPKSDKEIRDTIQKANEVHETRLLHEEFNKWLSDQRNNGVEDRAIAQALWEAAVIIYRAWEESATNGYQEELKAWFIEQGDDMFDTELAAALPQATKGLKKAHEAARVKGQEKVFQTFVDDARAQGKPDAIIFEEWSAQHSSQGDSSGI